MLTLDNIEQEIDRYANLSHENSYKIEIDVESHSCNGSPQIYIQINDQTYHEEKVETNKTYITDTFIENNSSCKIVIGMIGKTEQNTKSENNKIVEDQFVRICDIRINKISIVKNNLYFFDYNKFTKSDTKEVLTKTDGLYYNGELSLEIPTPIFPFLSNLRQQKINRFLSQQKGGKLSYGKTITSKQRSNLIQTVFG